MKAKKIIKALNIMQNYCKKSICGKCLFGNNDGSCNLRDEPHEWELDRVSKRFEERNVTGIKNVREV